MSKWKVNWETISPTRLELRTYYYTLVGSKRLDSWTLFNLKGEEVAKAPSYIKGEYVEIAIEWANWFIYW